MQVDDFIKVDCIICKKDNAKFIIQKDGMNTVQCRTCHLIYTNPRLKDATLSKNYEHVKYQFSSVEADKEFELQLPLAEERIPSLRKYKTNGRLLDVGCGMGAFLQVAKRNGFEVYGIEPSDPNCLYAREKLNIQAIHQGFIPDVLTHFTQKFSVITMFHVLEHLYNPVHVLTSLLPFLEKDGVLVVEVPNVKSIKFTLQKEKWYYLQPEQHLFYFSPDTLKKVLEMSGYSIIQFETITASHKNPLKNWIHSIASYFQMNDVLRVYARPR